MAMQTRHIHIQSQLQHAQHLYQKSHALGNCSTVQSSRSHLTCCYPSKDHHAIVMAREGELGRNGKNFAKIYNDSLNFRYPAG
jgi:hypothetical protein